MKPAEERLQFEVKDLALADHFGIGVMKPESVVVLRRSGPQVIREETTRGCDLVTQSSDPAGFDERRGPHFFRMTGPVGSEQRRDRSST